jgi:hypothetical protein
MPKNDEGTGTPEQLEKWDKHFNQRPPAAPKTQQPEKVSSSPWMDALAKRSYTYDDLLAAWIAGRANFRQYGDTGYDAPDFITWLKERGASIDQAQRPARTTYEKDKH